MHRSGEVPRILGQERAGATSFQQYRATQTHDDATFTQTEILLPFRRIRFASGLQGNICEERREVESSTCTNW